MKSRQLCLGLLSLVLGACGADGGATGNAHADAPRSGGGGTAGSLGQSGGQTNVSGSAGDAGAGAPGSGGIAGGASSAGAGLGGGSAGASGGDSAAGGPTAIETITLDPTTAHGNVSQLLLGGNGRWAYDNFGAWDHDTQQAYPSYIQALKDSAVTSVRYPGGTIANLYHWQQAIGPLAQRIDQVHGSTREPLDNDFGPDEYGKQSEALAQRGTMLVNFATGTPGEAADWVEYMTGVVGQNLNGGKDWAAVRAANGHAAPYDIPYWEVGNEMDLGGQLYWRDGTSKTDSTTLYALGGSTAFTKQHVAKQSDARASAAISDGSAGQTFVAQYPPITAGTATVYVGAQAWTRTQSLAGAAAGAQVFDLNLTSGQLTFGDGTHGAIPPKGSTVAISYTSGPHAGFADFYAAMKTANPNVKICAGLSATAGNVAFAQIMGQNHPYDCVAHHAYVRATIDSSVDANEYHSRLMLFIGGQVDDLHTIQNAIVNNAGARAPQIEIVATEYGQLGDSHPDSVPNYHASLSQGILMANYLVEFIKFGIPLADKSNLNDFVFTPAPGGSDAVGAPLNAMIAGPGPDFAVQPTGLVPNLFKPLVNGAVLEPTVTNNAPYLLENGQRMPTLTTVAARQSGGELYLVVVNQNPKADVAARVRPGLSHAPTVDVTTLSGATVVSRNVIGDDQVKISHTTTSVGATDFTLVFPAHSVTLIGLGGTGG